MLEAKEGWELIIN